MESIFKLSERGTTVKTEILAGFTNPHYHVAIIFVNPAILADAGIPLQAAIAAYIGLGFCFIINGIFTLIILL